MKYIKPETEIICIKQQYALLGASQEVTLSETEVDPGSSLSRDELDDILGGGNPLPFGF